MEEFPNQIGDQLRKAREDAGLTMEDVHFRTRIPRSVVAALEEGDFSIFSSPAYAKSFLSQYSGFLAIDASQWLEALVPASFVSGEFLRPQWMQPEERITHEIVVVPENSGGWLAGASVLVVSCAMVFAAFQGYQLLDARFGDAGGQSADDPPKIARIGKPAEPPVLPELTSLNPERGSLEPAMITDSPNRMPDESSERPPRAILVP